ncbi:hypothetical protein DPMN_008386 [Dreissena polymorpha]|uniref:Uncharacterized protein n=1 Tax=Dreissena polymorpha TaxID=45954 RepID=A0A9D4MXZ9_DREPO|nr:hypothetical protein DPMN_008386 [Dreissena polymorpha]
MLDAVYWSRVWTVIPLFVYFPQEKKVDLKETLIADLEEKRRSVELERSQLELTGGHCNFLLSTSLGMLGWCKSQFLLIFSSTIIYEIYIVELSYSPRHRRSRYRER